MFTNFNKTFKQNNDLKIPKEIIKILNEKLPEKFEYKQLDKNVCGIARKDGKPMDVKAKTKLPNIPPEIEKQIKTSKDLHEYLYRTQKKIEIMPDKNGNIKVNDELINVNDFIKDIKHEYKNARIELSTQGFPPPVETIIKAGGISRKFNIERQPYESMNIIYLKSVEKRPIEIQLYIKDKNAINAKININLNDIEEIKEITEICQFYEGFLKGDVIIGNSKIDSVKHKKTNNTTLVENKIDFWKKVLKVEETLGIKLKASNFESEDYITVLRLYRCLIEKKPFKLPSQMQAFEMDKSQTNGDVDKLLGKKMKINCQSKDKIRLFKQDIELYAAIYMYNYEIKAIKKSKDKIKIILQEEENKTAFNAIMYVKTEKEVEECQKEKNDQLFENAELI